MRLRPEPFSWNRSGISRLAALRIGIRPDAACSARRRSKAPRTDRRKLARAARAQRSTSQPRLRAITLFAESGTQVGRMRIRPIIMMIVSSATQSSSSSRVHAARVRSPSRSALHLAPPPLPTLNRRPSWLNARGNIDRSACVEIRVSEARQLAGCYHQRASKYGAWRPAGITRPLPNQTPAHRVFRAFTTQPSPPNPRSGIPNPESPISNRQSKIVNRRSTSGVATRHVTGILTISAFDLHCLHETRRPRLLAGDFRTSRAPAMRLENYQPPTSPCDLNTTYRRHNRRKPDHHRFRCRIDRAHPIAWPFDRNLQANPNKGAAKSKIIGLHEPWRQHLRLEQWTFPNRIRPAYYFICPGIHRGARGGRGEGAFQEARSRSRFSRTARPHRSRSRLHADDDVCPNPSSAFSACSAVTIPEPPPLSTRPPGRVDPSKTGGRCPQRCLKLLMVMCTRDEARDADRAQQWIDFINSLPGSIHFIHHHPDVAPHYARIIARYGILFYPRQLMCPRCVGAPGSGGVHYGNNPETVRQGWRRRNNKPDTTVASNLKNVPIDLGMLARRDYQMQMFERSVWQRRQERTDARQAATTLARIARLKKVPGYSQKKLFQYLMAIPLDRREEIFMQVEATEGIQATRQQGIQGEPRRDRNRQSSIANRQSLDASMPGSLDASPASPLPRRRRRAASQSKIKPAKPRLFPGRGQERDQVRGRGRAAYNKLLVAVIEGKFHRGAR